MAQPEETIIIEDQPLPPGDVETDALLRRSLVNLNTTFDNLGEESGFTQFTPKTNVVSNIETTGVPLTQLKFKLAEAIKRRNQISDRLNDLLRGNQLRTIEWGQGIPLTEEWKQLVDLSPTPEGKAKIFAQANRQVKGGFDVTGKPTFKSQVVTAQSSAAFRTVELGRRKIDREVAELARARADATTLSRAIFQSKQEIKDRNPPVSVVRKAQLTKKLKESQLNRDETLELRQLEIQESGVATTPLPPALKSAPLPPTEIISPETPESRAEAPGKEVLEPRRIAFESEAFDDSYVAKDPQISSQYSASHPGPFPVGISAPEGDHPTIAALGQFMGENLSHMAIAIENNNPDEARRWGRAHHWTEENLEEFIRGWSQSILFTKDDPKSREGRFIAENAWDAHAVSQGWDKWRYPLRDAITKTYPLKVRERDKRERELAQAQTKSREPRQEAKFATSFQFQALKLQVVNTLNNSFGNNVFADLSESEMTQLMIQISRDVVEEFGLANAVLLTESQAEKLSDELQRRQDAFLRIENIVLPDIPLEPVKKGLLPTRSVTKAFAKSRAEKAEKAAEAKKTKGPTFLEKAFTTAADTAATTAAETEEFVPPDVLPAGISVRGSFSKQDFSEIQRRLKQTLERPFASPSPSVFFPPELQSDAESLFLGDTDVFQTAEAGDEDTMDTRSKTNESISRSGRNLEDTWTLEQLGVQIADLSSSSDDLIEVDDLRTRLAKEIKSKLDLGPARRRIHPKDLKSLGNFRAGLHNTQELGDAVKLQEQYKTHMQRVKKTQESYSSFRPAQGENWVYKLTGAQNSHGHAFSFIPSQMLKLARLNRIPGLSDNRALMERLEDLDKEARRNTFISTKLPIDLRNFNKRESPREVRQIEQAFERIDRQHDARAKLVIEGKDDEFKAQEAGDATSLTQEEKLLDIRAQQQSAKAAQVLQMGILFDETNGVAVPKVLEKRFQTQFALVSRYNKFFEALDAKPLAQIQALISQKHMEENQGLVQRLAGMDVHTQGRPDLQAYMHNIRNRYGLSPEHRDHLSYNTTMSMMDRMMMMSRNPTGRIVEPNNVGHIPVVINKGTPTERTSFETRHVNPEHTETVKEVLDALDGEIQADGTWSVENQKVFDNAMLSLGADVYVPEFRPADKIRRARRIVRSIEGIDKSKSYKPRHKGSQTIVDSNFKELAFSDHPTSRRNEWIFNHGKVIEYHPQTPENVLEMRKELKNKAGDLYLANHELGKVKKVSLDQIEPGLAYVFTPKVTDLHGKGAGFWQVLKGGMRWVLRGGKKIHNLEGLPPPNVPGLIGKIGNATGEFAKKMFLKTRVGKGIEDVSLGIKGLADGSFKAAGSVSKAAQALGKIKGGFKDVQKVVKGVSKVDLSAARAAGARVSGQAGEVSAGLKAAKGIGTGLKEAGKRFVESPGQAGVPSIGKSIRGIKETIGKATTARAGRVGAGFAGALHFSDHDHIHHHLSKHLDHGGHFYPLREKHIWEENDDIAQYKHLRRNRDHVHLQPWRVEHFDPTEHNTGHKPHAHEENEDRVGGNFWNWMKTGLHKVGHEILRGTHLLGDFVGKKVVQIGRGAIKTGKAVGSFVKRQAKGLVHSAEEFGHTSKGIARNFVRNIGKNASRVGHFFHKPTIKNLGIAFGGLGGMVGNVSAAILREAGQGARFLQNAPIISPLNTIAGAFIPGLYLAEQSAKISEDVSRGQWHNALRETGDTAKSIALSKSLGLAFKGIGQLKPGIKFLTRSAEGEANNLSKFAREGKSAITKIISTHQGGSFVGSVPTTPLENAENASHKFKFTSQKIRPKPLQRIFGTRIRNQGKQNASGDLQPDKSFREQKMEPHQPMSELKPAKQFETHHRIKTGIVPTVMISRKRALRETAARRRGVHRMMVKEPDIIHRHGVFIGKKHFRK